jgi:hypothetical protein
MLHRRLDGQASRGPDVYTLGTCPYSRGTHPYVALLADRGAKTLVQTVGAEAELSRTASTRAGVVLYSRASRHDVI